MDSAVGGPWRADCRAIGRKLLLLAATAHTPKPPERQSSHFEIWMDVRAETNIVTKLGSGVQRIKNLAGRVLRSKNFFSLAVKIAKAMRGDTS